MPVLISISSIHNIHRSITSEHTFHKIAEWSPEVFTTGKTMLVNEENIVLKAGIEMSLQPKFTNHRVVMTVYVCINPVHPLEYLTDHAWEGLGKRNAYSALVKNSPSKYITYRYDLGTQLRCQCCSGPSPSDARCTLEPASS